MGNFQFWGQQKQNVDFLLTNSKIQKSTLLVKISSDDPEIQNLLLIHLPIYKKFSIWGLPDHFLEGSLTKKPKSQNFFLVSDPFKKRSPHSEIENFPLIHLRIYKKIFFSGFKSQIFINKVGF